MDRITQNDLDLQVDRINKATKSPETSYTRTHQGKLTANIGNYNLDYAYGGVRLVQMVNPSGGITVVSSDGFGTKRKLYNWMDAFLAGIAI